jgi:hypothetical protein
MIQARLIILVDRSKDGKDLTNDPKPTIEPNQGSSEPENASNHAPTLSLGQHPGSHDDPNTQLQETEFESMQPPYQELGLEFPDWLVEKLAARYDGMTPMERFLAETCQTRLQSHGMLDDELVSDCGATYATSMEGGSV